MDVTPNPGQVWKIPLYVKTLAMPPGLLRENDVPLSENPSQALVAHAYNPSYSGGRDQEDRG
jgi:hypothetical protein